MARKWPLLALKEKQGVSGLDSSSVFSLIFFCLMCVPKALKDPKSCALQVPKIDLITARVVSLLNLPSLMPLSLLPVPPVSGFTD
jgi:hypothetical protein